MEKEFLIIEVNKVDDVLPLNVSIFDSLLEQMRDNPQMYHNSIHLLFNGYDEDSREIYDIKEIREWVEKLLYTYPDILYFLEEPMKGLQNILLCLSDFVSLKKIVDTNDTPILSNMDINNVYLQAMIPPEQIEAILLRLSMTSFSEEHPECLPITTDRLMTFCS